MPIRFRCPQCGHESLVPDEYAGKSGPCKQCGRSVTVPAATQAAPALPTPREVETPRGLKTMLLVAGAVIGLCCCGGVPALLYQARESAHEAGRGGDCRDNMRAIGLAMVQYESARGHLPPAYVADKDGKPMHSWRVLILPYLDQRELYEQYRMDEPWNSPHNSRLADQMPEEYSCLDEDAAPLTQYAVMTGPGLVFDGPNKMSFKDITDGLTRTLLIVECHEAKIHWMEPRDLDAATMAPTSTHPGSVNVVFADSHVHILKNDIDPKVFGALLTPRGGEQVDESQF